MKKFRLKFLWLDKCVAVSLDQVVKGNSVPLTKFYFWPQKDAWEEIKLFLETLTWISREDAVNLLNQVTEVINFWQNKELNNSKEVLKVKDLFPSVYFVGYD
jgi:30S ribosomal protein 3